MSSWKEAQEAVDGLFKQLVSDGKIRNPPLLHVYHPDGSITTYTGRIMPNPDFGTPVELDSEGRVLMHCDKVELNKTDDCQSDPNKQP